MATQPQEPESPAEEEPTEPAFDIQTWIDYAKAYAESIGLRMESSAVDCWDNPISVGTHCSYLERDIQSRLNRYARDEDITDVWIWRRHAPTGNTTCISVMPENQIFTEERTEKHGAFFHFKEVTQ